MKREKEEYGKDKVIQRIVNSSPAFVSLASSILLETVSRWKLYGIRLCLPLSRTAFHPRRGKGIGLNFQEEFHEVYQRLRGTCKVHRHYHMNSQSQKLARRASCNQLVISWKSRRPKCNQPVIFVKISTGYVIRSFLRFVHETIIIVGDEKKGKSISLSRREFSSRIFINYNGISPRIAIEYANSTVIECIFNFQKWSTEEEDNKFGISTDVSILFPFYPRVNMVIKLPYMRPVNFLNLNKRRRKLFPTIIWKSIWIKFSFFFFQKREELVRKNTIILETNFWNSRFSF